MGVLASTGILKRGLEIAFTLIILLSGFRYNFGADYMNYLQMFKEVAAYPDLNYIFHLYDTPFDKPGGTELGWVLLCWLFKPFGFNTFVFFTSVITNIVYYRFIKSYVSRKWYWLALFVYMFDTNLFFVPLSMMRQSLAMVVFVYSFKYIVDKKNIQALLLVLLASMFHQSALVLIPFAFLGFLSRVNGKITSIAYVMFFLLLLGTKDLTSNIIMSALSLSSFEAYAGYFTKMEAADAFGLGFASRLVTFFIPFLFYYSDESQRFPNRLSTLMSGMSFLIAPFTLIMGFLGRIDYYFSIYNIVAIPLLFGWFKKGIICYGLIIIYIAYTLYSYNQFFKIPDWITFTHYQTFLGF